MELLKFQNLKFQIPKWLHVLWNLEFVYWNLFIGICLLEFVYWNLGFVYWNLGFVYCNLPTGICLLKFGMIIDRIFAPLNQVFQTNKL